MALENNIAHNQGKHKKRRKKARFKFKNKSTILLISVPILLLILINIELAQLFFPFKDLIKKAAVSPRPVYIVDSQPIDIDAYLQEYFANKIPKKTMQVTVTAYSSTNGETDETPYHTAIGTFVRDGIVAANFLPIGTVIRFPDKFGEKLFIVEDRMDERFGLQVDIWMSNQEEAKKFGIQYMKMEIF
ncbi:3D domain-containing protein [Patescibacteria group bacterium]|nr:3D domain-containing protein [Patescibacteria group bacterium]